MDNDHNIIITPKGQYTYDADFDCYRRVPDLQDHSHWNTYGWIYAVVLMSAFSIYMSL